MNAMIYIKISDVKKDNNVINYLTNSFKDRAFFWHKNNRIKLHDETQKNQKTKG